MTPPRRSCGTGSWFNLWRLALSYVLFAAPGTAPAAPTNGVFTAHGVVREVNAAAGTVTIRHDAIPGYMAAMTMPFKVQDAREIPGLRRDDEIVFQLHVTANESWVDGLVRIGRAAATAADPPGSRVPPVLPGGALSDLAFTNELGQPVRLHDFQGQALAITFFYTRCPLPDYCPRLSKNFQEASQRLAALPGGPTNWHFLSVTFDPAFDSPPRLKAYAQSYQYTPAHWSFLTGPVDALAALAHSAGVTWRADGDGIDHDFRTLIVDARGHLQMVFPTGGNLSDQVVAEMLKAATVGRP
jgi:protein SCO1/2